MALEGKQKADELPSQLTDDQREKIRNLKTPEEMLAFVESEGIDITDEQLSDISGGKFWWPTGGYK